MDTVLLIDLPAFVPIVISEISVPAIEFVSTIVILLEGVIVLIVIDDSGTKDDVLKLVAIDNINRNSVRKSTTYSVLIVEIFLVYWVLTIQGDPVGRMYVDFTEEDWWSSAD